MVAALLHLDEGARAAGEAGDQTAPAVLAAPAMMSPTAEPAPSAPAFRLAASRRCRARGAHPAARPRRSGAICAAQPVTTIARAGPLAAHAADRLPRLPLGLGGDGAGVDHDRVGERARRGRG